MHMTQTEENAGAPQTAVEFGQEITIAAGRVRQAQERTGLCASIPVLRMQIRVATPTDTAKALILDPLHTLMIHTPKHSAEAWILDLLHTHPKCSAVPTDLVLVGCCHESQ